MFRIYLHLHFKCKIKTSKYNNTTIVGILHLFHILDHNAPGGRQVFRSAAARASPPVAASRTSSEASLFDTFTKKSEEK